MKETKHTLRTLGATNHSLSERQKDDFYATPPEATEYLLNFGLNFTKNILEPAVGMGHISNVLEQHGFKVKKLDIIDRGSKDTEIQNFLEYYPNELNDADIITNPPYKLGIEFVKHSFEISKPGVKIAMFLKLQFLEGQDRKKFFEENNPKYVYVTSSRMACGKDGEFYKDGKKIGSAVAYAWFIWEKGYKGDTILRWFN